MRRALAYVWHHGCRGYRSDLAFTLATNVALALVVLLVLLWLVLAVTPRTPPDPPPVSTPGLRCSWLEGRCW